MANEDTGRFDDPPARSVSIQWVWPDRYLLCIGDDVATVITGAEVGMLAGEAVREAGRNGV